MKRFFAMLLAVCMTFCACAFAEEDGTDLSYVDVKERGALRVGMDNAYAPFCFVDETNEYTGFDVDFAYAICDALGVELEVVPIEWKNARSALEDGSVDMLLCGFTMWILGYRKWKVLIPCAIVIAAVVFGVFYGLMRVPLPTLFL